MDRIKVEFVNTCPCCNHIGEHVKKVSARYGDKVECHVYMAGRDFDYVKKYGMLSKGTLIINEKDAYDTLSPEIVEKIIVEAVEGKA